MLRRALLIATLTLSTALASDLNLGVKLYSDEMYSLAAKTFSENLDSLNNKNFKKYYRYIYLSFLKSQDYKDLKRLLSFWERNFPEFSKGELLALKFLLSLKNGAPVEKAFPEKDLLSMSIDNKVSFFKVLSKSDLPSNALYFTLLRSGRNLELKGALRDSGFLEGALKRASRENDYKLIDLIFDTYGRWFKGKEEGVQYVRYLERKRRFSEALVEAQKLYKKYPDDRTRLELARAYYLNKKYSKAAKLLKNPKSTEEKYLLAWTLYRLGKVDEIPKVIGLNISKPKVPEKLKALLDFYSAEFDLDTLKKFYPELYTKALIFSFSDEIPEVGSSDDLGYIYYERGLYKSSEEELKRAVQSPSNDLSTARTLYLLGKIGTINSDVGSVVYSQLMGSFQNTPYYRASLLDAAKVYLISGSPNVSIKLLEYAYKEEGIRTPELLKLLGISYFNVGNYKRAKEFLKRVPDGDTLTLLAICQYKLGSKKEAYRTLKKEIKKYSIFPEVNGGRLIYLSKVLGKERELTKLPLISPLTKTMAAFVSKNINYAERIFDTLPHREKTALALYLTESYEEKKPQKSIFYLTYLFNTASNEELERFSKQYMNYLSYKSKNFEALIFNDPYFIAYNPENVGADALTLISKARDYESNGEYGKAYGILKLTLEKVNFPKLKEQIAERLVEIDLKQKNYRRALKDISLIQDSDVKNYLLFRTYLSQGKLIDAYTAAQSVKDITKIPEKERGYFLGKLAHYYKLTGNKNRALEISRELTKYLSSANYDDLVSLGILAQESGDLELAEKLIGEAVKRAKKREERAESLFWRASIEAQRGNVDGALIDYMKIAYEIKVEPWSSTALYRAAQLLEKKGDYRQAARLYKRVSEMKKGTKEGEEAEERLKSLLKRLKKEE
jgi:Flp pilus assembly protein TadD